MLNATHKAGNKLKIATHSAPTVSHLPASKRNRLNKPTKANIGKVTNDTLGYFHLSKQNLLSNPNNFIKMMIEYDKEHIEPSVVKNVKKIIEDPSFALDAIKNSSEALLGICKWAMAMVKYYELLKIVNPKREKVKEMT